jgi:hypothetical protein
MDRLPAPHATLDSSSHSLVNQDVRLADPVSSLAPPLSPPVLIVHLDPSPMHPHPLHACNVQLDPLSQRMDNPLVYYVLQGPILAPLVNHSVYSVLQDYMPLLMDPSLVYNVIRATPNHSLADRHASNVILESSPLQVDNLNARTVPLVNSLIPLASLSAMHATQGSINHNLDNPYALNVIMAPTMHSPLNPHASLVGQAPLLIRPH